MKTLKNRLRSALCISPQQSLNPPPPMQPAPENTLIDTFIHTSAGDVVPPELFELILTFASTDDQRREVERRLRLDKRIHWLQRQQEVYKAGPMYTLTSCALVCRYWAKQCRQFLFKDARLHIRSYESAEAFRKCTILCPPTIGPPIATYIKIIDVTIDYKSSKPFLELIYLPQTRNKLIRLKILGPFPDKLAPALRDTPHWNLSHNALNAPPAIVSYKEVTILNLSFPSFQSIVKYIQHFGDVESLNLFSIKWDPASSVPPTFVESARRPIRRQKVQVLTSGCTNNLLLCLHAAMMYADFPLRGIPASDQQWVVDFLTTIDMFYSNLPKAHSSSSSSSDENSKYTLACFDKNRPDMPSLSFQLYGLPPDYPQLHAHFVCKPRPPLKNRPSSPSSPSPSPQPHPLPTRILGISITIESPQTLTSPSKTIKHTIDLTKLRKQINELCAVQVVVLAFGDYTALKTLVKAHPTVGEPLGDGRDGRKYLLACRRTGEWPFDGVKGGNGSFNRTWVGIDPVTLEATGDNWDTDSDIIPALFSGS